MSLAFVLEGNKATFFGEVIQTPMPQESGCAVSEAFGGGADVSVLTLCGVQRQRRRALPTLGIAPFGFRSAQLRSADWSAPLPSRVPMTLQAFRRKLKASLDPFAISEGFGVDSLADIIFVRDIE